MAKKKSPLLALILFGFVFVVLINTCSDDSDTEPAAPAAESVAVETRDTDAPIGPRAETSVEQPQEIDPPEEQVQPDPPAVEETNVATSSPAPTQSENTTAAESQWGVLVTADEYGDKWPLTVSEARVNLLSGKVAILRAGGRTYALNGTAQSRGYQRIDPIWRDNLAIPGTKISISPLIQRALSLEEEDTDTTSTGSSSTQDTLGGSIGETVEAWVIAKQFVLDKLISPSTAKFNGAARSPYVVYLGDARYRVTASVDSQNSFGAMLRTEFVVIVRAERDEHQTWTLENLEF